MMDKDRELEVLLKNDPKTKVVVLGFGEEREFNYVSNSCGTHDNRNLLT